MKRLETTGLLSVTFSVGRYYVVITAGLSRNSTNVMANFINSTWFQMLYCRERNKDCTIKCVTAFSMCDLNSSFLVGTDSEE